MSKVKNIWVFSDIIEKYPELLSGAVQNGEQVFAVTIGNDNVEMLAKYGADKVYSVAKSDGNMVEDYATTIAGLIKNGDKDALVMIGSSKRGKAVATKLSVALNAPVVNEITSIVIDANGISVKHMVYGGLAIGEERVASANGFVKAIVTVGGGVFEPQEMKKAISSEDVPFVQPNTSIKCIERKAKVGSSVNLSKAKKVVGVGRGIAAKADLDMVNTLANAIGAEVGCSRPIAEGENWMERERYIGVSGVMLKPDVYLALGISGQIQHMVGTNAATTILAVNKDKNAPIFGMVDYGIVGDIYKVVPALIAKLKG